MIMIDLATLPPQTAQAIRHGEIVQFVENGKPIIHEEPMLNSDLTHLDLTDEQADMVLDLLENPKPVNKEMQALLDLARGM